ncbi:MAG: TRAP transporter small permease subunit [Pseudomonadota bacterium]
MSLLAEAWGVVASFMTFDSFEIRDALREEGAWLFGIVVVALGSFLVVQLYRRVPVLDRNLEKWVSVWTYLVIAAIIFVEVVLRFYGNFESWLTGTPVTYSNGWATTVPPLFFLVMAWYGCAYNVRLRTHLSFSELRTAMPRRAQIACLTLDFVLWWGFCLIVFVTTARATAFSAFNFRIVGSTDNVMQWWFYITIPVAFILLGGRALQNYLGDLRRFRNGEPLIERAVIGGDV